MHSKLTTFTELILKGLLLFSIFTVIQGIEAFESINRIWFASLTFAVISRLVVYRYTSKEIAVFFTTLVIHAIALYFTEFPLVNTNMLFYFLFWVILYVFFAKSKERILRILDKNGNFIRTVICVWTAIVGVSVFLPSCYVDRYFYSFAGHSFRLMPAVLIITALTMYMSIHKRDRRYEWFLVLPTYAAFMNKSRVYFAIYVLIVLMYLYMRVKRKRSFYMLLIPLCGIMLGLMMITGISDKLESVRYTEQSYFDFWGTITNGRTEFWVWDIEAFFALPFWQQFVGNGFNFVYDVNRKNMAEIWAHNDIINVLMNFGYIGAVIYLWSFNKLVRAFWQKGNAIPSLIKFLFLGAVFLNSMFNMSYTYLCAMISYPLFLCVIASRYQHDDLNMKDECAN